MSDLPRFTAICGAAAFPSFALLRPVSAQRPLETAVFAAGCYWSAEAVFEHVRGVSTVVSGFADPNAPKGAAPASGRPHKGYAEAVTVTYDPSRITYRDLLHVFFSAAHDPTEVDRQGPDV